jgi:hypothetical protein
VYIAASSCCQRAMRNSTVCYFFNADFIKWSACAFDGQSGNLCANRNASSYYFHTNQSYRDVMK